MSSIDILRAFAEHFKRKYDMIPVSSECMKRIMDCNLTTVPDGANLALEEPVMLEEIQHAIQTGKLHKAPGHDGICQEFLKKMWETTKEDLLPIVNEMYRDAFISEHQKFGIIVGIPKQPNALHIEDYTPHDSEY